MFVFYLYLFFLLFCLLADFSNVTRISMNPKIYIKSTVLTGSLHITQCIEESIEIVLSFNFITSFQLKKNEISVNIKFPCGGAIKPIKIQLYNWGQVIRIAAFMAPIKDALYNNITRGNSVLTLVMKNKSYQVDKKPIIPRPSFCHMVPRKPKLPVIAGSLKITFFIISSAL